MSRVKRVKRRIRCVRKGHFWLQRLDAHDAIEVFCGRCGRRRLYSVDELLADVGPLRVHVSDR
jgi:hypothetical protein